MNRLKGKTYIYNTVAKGCLYPAEPNGNQSAGHTGARCYLMI